MRVRVRSRSVLHLALSSLAAAASCALGPRAAVMREVEQRDSRGALLAYERFREDEEADGELLGHVAALVLEKEAIREEVDRREAAIVQLDLAGTAGREAMRRLDEERSHPKTRARALEMLARRGDDTARETLLQYADDANAEVAAAAVYALDPRTARGDLVERLQHPAGT